MNNPRLDQEYYTEYDKSIHNVVFIINNERVYTNLYFLLQYSLKFKMFFDDNKNNIRDEPLIEFTISGISQEELITFFNILMYSNKVSLDQYSYIIYLCEYFQIYEELIDFTSVNMTTDIVTHLLNSPYALQNYTIIDKINQWKSDIVSTDEYENFFNKIMKLDINLSSIIMPDIEWLFTMENSKNKVWIDIIFNFLKNRYMTRNHDKELLDTIGKINKTKIYSKSNFVGDVFIACVQLNIPNDIIGKIIHNFIVADNIKFFK